MQTLWLTGISFRSFLSPVFKKGFFMRLDQFIRREYDGKEFDFIEYMGDWNGFEVYSGLTTTSEDFLLAKDNKAWYASEDDCQIIKYVFGLDY